MWSVFFVVLSYLDRNVVEGALDTEKESEQMLSSLNGTFCAKMSMAGGSFLYQVSDGAEVVRSVVSPAGKLVDCSITVKHVQVKSFMQECMLGVKARPDAPFTLMDQARSMCREFTERTQGAQTDTRDDVEVQEKTLRRSKRGFTYPGTLWCGAGNMADNYDQLGHFAETDSCCRIHDHCPHVIHAFSSNYGHTNFKWHSICHCDCDNALKTCLRSVNDTSSRIVGQAFFNVISVPCFDFRYEEQCAERHWYGMCKQYEQHPIAVLREAVPYDFGGIDVIDELTVAPPHTKHSKSSKGEEKAEKPTQSPMPSPEEPSLRNVVTAAEDFIKVLATVSTSQSSNAESDKGQAPSSEKKKKKKKKKKKGKNPGKIRKSGKKTKAEAKRRKGKQKAGVQGEGGAAVSPSDSQAEDMKTLSNFLSESHRRDQSSSNSNRVGDGEFELEGKDEPSNEVMKDEPSTDEQTVSARPAVTDLKRPAGLELNATTEDVTLSVATTAPAPQKTKSRRPRKGKKSDKSRRTPPPGLERLAVTPTEKFTDVFVHVNVVTTVRPEQQSLTEMQLGLNAASPPTVPPTVKRSRSEKAGGREKRRKRRKGSSASPALLSAPQKSSVDSLQSFLSTTPSVPVTERLPSPPEEIQAAAVHSSFSMLKRQRSEEKSLRTRRRKTLTPPPSENPPLPLSSSENVLQIPDGRVALRPPESSAAAQREETQNETGLFTPAGTQRHRQAGRKQTKRRDKAGADAGGHVTSDTKQTQTLTLTAAPLTTAAAIAALRSEKPPVTSAGPTLSPIRWTIERAREQFARKKRRKAALFSRRQ